MNPPFLSSPAYIGSVKLKNRTVMTAMGVAMANFDGTVSNRMIAYYEERAKNGVGLIIPEFTNVSETGSGTLTQLSLADDRHIKPMRRLVSAVHRHGAKIFIQLNHAGRQSYNALSGGAPLVAPSAIPCGYCRQETRALTEEEIPALVAAFIQAACRAKAAHADGIELHCTHGYLLHQFLSPYANKRTDAYGGSVENRARIVCEIIRGIKTACGKDYPVIARVTAEEFLRLVGKPHDGIHLEDAIRFCRLFEQAGIDALNVSVGCYETVNTFIEPASFEEGWRIDLVTAIKQAVSIPTFGNSVIRHPAYAEKLLREGKVDFISMGRSFLADSAWTEKALNDSPQEIRRCIGCLHCIETFYASPITMQPAVCSVNARMGQESVFPWPPEVTGKGRIILILGAGPAGLECARVLAVRGFSPLVIEKGSAIGGQLRLAERLPHKEKIGWLIEYYQNELNRLGVEVRCNTTVSLQEAKKLSPYAVVIATGSNPIVPSGIPGIEGDNVCTARAFLSGGRIPKNQRIAVIGSGMTGLETAELLSENGNRVSIIEMADVAAPNAYIGSVMDIMQRLREHDRSILTQHKLIAVKAASILLERMDGVEVEQAADLVVLSLGSVSEQTVAPQFDGQFPRVYRIGDANQVGRIAQAISDGLRLAYQL